MTCTFFGHHNAPDTTVPTLRTALIDLIENHNVTLFYVGNHGHFDTMVRKILKELASMYPITYHVVLAYMPQENKKDDFFDYSDTILPEGIETVPKRFSISYRNKWMIRKSDFVVTYVTNHIGSGAAQFKELAEKQGKTVIEISS